MPTVQTARLDAVSPEFRPRLSGFNVRVVDSDPSTATITVEFEPLIAAPTIQNIDLDSIIPDPDEPPTIQLTERDVNPSAQLAIDEADHFLRNFHISELSFVNQRHDVEYTMSVDACFMLHPPVFTIENGLATITNGLNPVS